MTVCSKLFWRVHSLDFAAGDQVVRSTEPVDGDAGAGVRTAKDRTADTAFVSQRSVEDDSSGVVDPAQSGTAIAGPVPYKPQCEENDLSTREQEGSMACESGAAGWLHVDWFYFQTKANVFFQKQ